MHGEEGSVASSMDGTESMSSVQHSRLTLNPVPGRIAAKLISQEQEVLLRDHDFHLLSGDIVE